MFTQLGSVGPGLSIPVELRQESQSQTRADRVEPLRGGRATADLPTLPERASERAQEVARANRPDQRELDFPDGVPEPADLIPPDPNAPAGPPPAFEASILDRARQVALASLTAPVNDPASADRAAPLADGAMPDQPDPYTTPPSAEVRASLDVSMLRRFETPYDTTTVDVSC